MKLILCSAFFGLVAIVMFVKAGNHLNCRGRDLGDIAGSNFLNLISRLLPTNYNLKCFYYCLLSSAGMVNENGIIYAETFVHFINSSKEYDDATTTKIVKIVHECKNQQQDKDKCETVGHLALCSVEEAKKNDLNPMTMLAALRLPFFSYDANHRPKLIWTN